MTRVLFDTSLGCIVAEIFTDNAPITSRNFLRYLDEGRYENATFYRANRPDNDARSGTFRIIQGGMGPEYDGAPPLPPIVHESTNITGLSHVNGALSMARWAPGTAASEFFIVIGDTPQLDFGGSLNPDLQGFAAFGRVVEGLDVVHRINMSRTGTTSPIEFMRDQALTPPITMRVRRLHVQPLGRDAPPEPGLPR